MCTRALWLPHSPEPIEVWDDVLAGPVVNDFSFRHEQNIVEQIECLEQGVQKRTGQRAAMFISTRTRAHTRSAQHVGHGCSY